MNKLSFYHMYPLRNDRSAETECADRGDRPVKELDVDHISVL